jgi:methyl-accepting chemotaxis protein
MVFALSRVSLKLQIGVIGAAATAGMLLVGGIFAAGQSALGRDQAAMDAVYNLRQLTNSLNVELLEMRRAEKDFFLRRDDKYAERHRVVGDALVKP